METKTYYTFNKSDWPDGLWKSEPDKIQWQDAATGLPCLAKRNFYGAWCGYVGVDANHPLYGQHYDVPKVEVHGRLTYADSCQTDLPKEKAICHVPSEGETDDIWWFGFDCVHSTDFMPADPIPPDPIPPTINYGRYRTLYYVIAECRSLAIQLAIYTEEAKAQPSKEQS